MVIAGTQLGLKKCHDLRNVTSMYYAFVSWSSLAFVIFQHRAWVQKMIAGMLLHFFMPILKGHPRHFSAPSLIGFRKCHDNVTAIYYACLMVIAVAGTFQHRAWDHLIAGMLIQFITLVLLWTLPALFSTELGYKKCHDSWNVTSIYCCLSMALFSTELGFKKCQ